MWLSNVRVTYAGMDRTCLNMLLSAGVDLPRAVWFLFCFLLPWRWSILTTPQVCLLSTVTLEWRSTYGAAWRMGEVQAQPISSLTDLGPGAHWVQHWPLNTELLFRKSHAAREPATATSSLRTTFTTYASTFHSCWISIWNRNNLKTFSLASLFTWAGLASHRETTFSSLCFITGVYIPKARQKVVTV